MRETAKREGGERGTEGFFLERGLLGFLVLERGLSRVKSQDSTGAAEAW